MDKKWVNKLGKGGAAAFSRLQPAPKWSQNVFTKKCFSVEISASPDCKTRNLAGQNLVTFGVGGGPIECWVVPSGLFGEVISWSWWMKTFVGLYGGFRVS